MNKDMIYFGCLYELVDTFNTAQKSLIMKY